MSSFLVTILLIIGMIIFIMCLYVNHVLIITHTAQNLAENVDITGTNYKCWGNETCTINCIDCQDRTLRCPPTNYSCNIQCPDTESCYLSHIKWGETAGLGTITCGGDSACRGIEFPIPDPNIPLTINCNNRYECEESILYCPTNANCTIICNGQRTCKATEIIWPTNTSTTNTLTCDGRNACDQVDFPIPNPDISKTIICDSTSECQFATIYCPSNANCTVICSEQDSCTMTKIIWSDGMNLVNTLTCDNYTYCEDVTKPIALYINATDYTNDFNLICDAYGECESFIIDCPLIAGCFIF